MKIRFWLNDKKRRLIFEFNFYNFCSRLELSKWCFKLDQKYKEVIEKNKVIWNWKKCPKSKQKFDMIIGKGKRWTERLGENTLSLVKDKKCYCSWDQADVDCCVLWSQTTIIFSTIYSLIYWQILRQFKFHLKYVLFDFKMLFFKMHCRRIC